MLYEVITLRKGIDGLSMIIGDKYHQNPFEKGTLFLFCGRRSDRIKGLLWMGDGFLLLYKRLEDGRLVITSYSIHYTKLYELHHCPQPYALLIMAFSCLLILHQLHKSKAISVLCRCHCILFLEVPVKAAIINIPYCFKDFIYAEFCVSKHLSSFLGPDRITSYNVCYTKLLRVCRTGCITFARIKVSICDSLPIQIRRINTQSADIKSGRQKIY